MLSINSFLTRKTDLMWVSSSLNLFDLISMLHITNIDTFLGQN